MESIKYSDQQKDGSFRHYVVFGDIAPWDAPPEKCVECATEEDADKLLALLQCSLMGRVAELEAENKELTETATGYIDELTQSQAVLEAITGALKGEEPSDFMRSFPDVETAWWVYRLAYPSKV